jgi:MinD superfamily P-loop ATPase
MRRLDLSFGVVINRAISPERRVAEYCKSKQIPVLLEIPDDRRAAVAYSRGQLIVEAVPELRELFERLCCRILLEVERKEKCTAMGEQNVAGTA